MLKNVNLMSGLVVVAIIAADVVLTLMGKPVPAPITGGVALVCAALPQLFSKPPAAP